ncbi:MAG: hypothetical protein K8H87_12800 [Pseudorhodoplanes sp.]|nr:hypothetical protein [Pseudorhodoplanes sp.]
MAKQVADFRFLQFGELWALYSFRIGCGSFDLLLREIEGEFLLRFGDDFVIEQWDAKRTPDRRAAGPATAPAIAEIDSGRCEKVHGF